MNDNLTEAQLQFKTCSVKSKVLLFQIVVQVGDEMDGMVMIRSGDNRQGVCPLKFLQEV
jgi:hypothetical protein